MNLDALKLYCDVVRLRSFSRAATANGVTQSAASQSIQQLEGDLDVPLLDREFRDCSLDLALASRRIVDAMTIFHRKEPRDLTAAVRFFLDREHAGAHGAVADVEASIEVLEAQLQRYPDLPREVDALDAWCNPAPKGAVDRGGKFVLREGEVVFAFGKQKGRSLSEVARVQRDYLEWILKQDFPEDARTLVAKALKGE